MERIPNGHYTQEFREEAVKMVTDGGLSVLEISKRLSLPKSTLANWIRISKAASREALERSKRRLLVKQFRQVNLLPVKMIRGSKPKCELLRDSHNLINGGLTKKTALR